MPKKALRVDDMRNDFIDPKGVPRGGAGARAIRPYTPGRPAALRRAGARVLFRQDAHAPDDPGFERFAPHGVAGTRGRDRIPERHRRAIRRKQGVCGVRLT